MQDRGARLYMHKVKSHVEDLEAQARHHTWGNSCADFHAKESARQHQIPLKEEQAIHYTDGGPWFDDYKETQFSSLWSIVKIGMDRDE